MFSDAAQTEGRDMQDLYQALGVDKSASQDDVKKAYRKLTRELHPDKNPGNKQAEERFKAVSNAYEVIGDPERRALYDEFGEMSLTQGFDPERARAYKQARQNFGGYGAGGGGYGGFPGGNFGSYGDARGTSFDDLLSQLFGGGRVDLGGMGGMGGDPFGRTASRSRKGHDVQGEIRVSLLDSLLGVTVPLRVESSRDGSHRVIDVKVPEGVTDGSKLRLRGQGGSGDPPGDILLTIKVEPGRNLERSGNNLKLKLPVTALEAYRGGKLDVPTPWGTITMNLPPGTQNGQTLRLRDKGVRIKGEPQGDLFVSIDVRMPDKGDEELLAVLERLQGDTVLRREEALA